MISAAFEPCNREKTNIFSLTKKLDFFFNSLIIQKASVLTIITLERLVYWPEMSSVCSGVRGRRSPFWKKVITFIF